jgi:hypothetical protein
VDLTTVQSIFIGGLLFCSGQTRKHPSAKEGVVEQACNPKFAGEGKQITSRNTQPFIMHKANISIHIAHTFVNIYLKMSKGVKIQHDSFLS